jgi:hypothetical protein
MSPSLYPIVEDDDQRRYYRVREGQREDDSEGQRRYDRVREGQPHIGRAAEQIGDPIVLDDDDLSEQFSDMGVTSTSPFLRQQLDTRVSM